MEKSRRQRYTTYFALSAAVTGCCSSFQPTPNVRWRHPPYIHWMPTPIPSLSTNAVVPYISPWSPIQKSGRFMSNTPSSMPSPQKKNPLVSSLNKPRKILIQGRRRVRPVSLQHERDFFRQAARLESMDSYLLVSTLTASMSFGALLGFCPIIANAQVAAMSALRRFWYQAFCSAIPVVAGFSAMFGLYATVMFSLTILYGKSALGSERDLEYDKFLRRTVRSRVHGSRCFNLSLGLFAFEAFLVLLERTYVKPWFGGVLATTLATLWYLYRDWRLIFRMAEYIYKD